MTAPAGTYAQVRCTFIPSLPDELSISTGEHVRVVGEFDDGWALCENGRGEQGVVPLECLDRQTNPRAGQGPVQHQVPVQSQIQMSMSGRGTPVGGYNAYGNGVVGGGVGYGAGQQQGQQGYLGQGTGDWRMSRRASSLYAGVAAAMQQPTGGMHH
ncbi:hypothetical protein NLI96_g12250 [Meripilus lineatus]|uniref:SH3 domain-containing protein n=1 Tax=Meripilus lineatus TaxID=2056292 RepID=A0AAD5UQ82_9APHY|nr:hypothetical protein NLI96_g12250 [Physisporinus lineatus]